MIGLTKQQRKAYDFIQKTILTQGISPSYEEIAAHCGCSSKSNAHRIVHALAEKGLLKVHKGIRAIEVIKPDSAETHLYRLIQILRNGPLVDHPVVKDAMRYLKISSE